MADMLSDEDETPMFVGWNAQLLPTDDEIHNVVYLPQINSSPTLYSVVQETMNRALRIAEERGKTSIVDFNITGAERTHPGDWILLFENVISTALIEFLIGNWKSGQYVL